MVSQEFSHQTNFFHVLTNSWITHVEEAQAHQRVQTRAAVSIMANVVEVLSSLTTGQLTTVIAVLILLSVITIRQKYHIKYPCNLPRAGEPPGKTTFSLKTRLAYYNDAEQLFKEAYNTVSHLRVH